MYTFHTSYKDVFKEFYKNILDMKPLKLINLINVKCIKLPMLHEERY